MPVPATDADVSAVATFLTAQSGKHLRCRKRADTIVIESGPPNDAFPRLRLRKLSSKNWSVDAATHTERWERMPLQGPLLDVLGIVTADFSWLLAPT